MKKLKRLIRKFILGHDISTYFFSQSGEDAILSGLFNSKLKNRVRGFYVDIGAYHPNKFSNTQLFYNEGWCGINIDARPGSKKLFDKYRKNDINLELGIGTTSGILDYFFFGEDSCLNTFSKEEVVASDNLYKVKKTFHIEVRTLSSVLKEHLPKDQSIDFMNIDVEGFDLEVLQSNDWEKYRPEVLLVEQKAFTMSDVANDKITAFLGERGYQVVAKTIVNNNISTVIYKELS